MKRLSVRSKQSEEFIDITSQVQKMVSQIGTKNGICAIFTPHTTAALTINENADPDVQRDMQLCLGKVFPEDPQYRHFEHNSYAHIRSSVIGCSETILVEDGKLVLGRWQAIYLCEFDGPKTREILVSVR